MLFSIFEDDLNRGKFIVYLTFMIPIIIIKLRQIILRLHDINKSGWYCMISFIPILNILLLSLHFIDGTKGKNKFGDDPKGRINTKEFLNIKAQIEKQNFQESPEETDRKIKLLMESYKDGILDENEFFEKKHILLEEKEQLQKMHDNKNKFLNKKKKLNSLLENNVLNKEEFNIKMKILLEKYDQPNSGKLNLDEKFYYLKNSLELGPFSFEEMISKINNNKIYNKWTCNKKLDFKLSDYAASF